MSGPLVTWALRRSLDQIRYVSPVRPTAAKGVVAAIYQQVERDFGMLAPPVALHSPAPGPLAACWLILRETLVVPGLASRAAKETVAAAVSLGNTCPYCVAVHTAAVRGLLRDPTAAELAAGRVTGIPDPRLRAIAAWARESGLRNHALAGDATRPGVPFPAEQLPELAGVAVTFHYLNRMVNVFLGDSPLPAAVPATAKGALMALLGRLIVSADSTATPAELPPPAQPSGDFPWADRSPRLSSAFTRAAAAMDRAGADTVPRPVRELVLSELASWDGHPRGPSRSWALAIAARLPEADRAAGLLALLTAFSPYQVIAADIAAFRAGGPDDETLVCLTSWTSFAAARHIGGWLRLRGPDPHRQPVADA